MKGMEGKQKYGTMAGVFVVVAVFLMKFKVAIFAAFKAVPLLKLGWLLKGSGSMILSLGLYAATFGWRYAVTLVGLIYVHEMGHYIWMKAKGLNPQAPVFVPFLGAYVAMNNLPKDMATHAWVAYAGPLVGGLGAFALYQIGIYGGNQYLVAAANTGFFLNLLQLVPVRPFDGGFIAGAISKWISVPGIIILIVVALSTHSVLLIIISAFALLKMISQWRSGAILEQGLKPASAVERCLIGIFYFALAAALGCAYFVSEDSLNQMRGLHGL